MTSQDTKQQRLAAARLLRARAVAGIDPCHPAADPPRGAVLADPAALAHNNTGSRLPRFYVDRIVVCRDCGTEEVWPAERQKWWYEEAKGGIDTRAVRCRACRERENERRAAARRTHLEGLARKRREGGGA